MPKLSGNKYPLSPYVPPGLSSSARSQARHRPLNCSPGPYSGQEALNGGTSCFYLVRMMYSSII